MPGFLKLFCSHVGICVCPPLREIITSRMIQAVFDWLHHSTAFQFIAVDKLDGRGLSNTVHCAHQAKMTAY